MALYVQVQAIDSICQSGEHAQTTSVITKKTEIMKDKSTAYLKANKSYHDDIPLQKSDVTNTSVWSIWVHQSSSNNVLIFRLTKENKRGWTFECDIMASNNISLFFSRSDFEWIHE